jgi:3-dehydroquinate synthase
MDLIQQTFSVQFSYPVYFTTGLFQLSNPLFRQFLKRQQNDTIKKLLFVIDDGVVKHHPSLERDIENYVTHIDGYALSYTLVIPGGERCKNEKEQLNKIIEIVNECGVDRHSYLIGIGGGSLLDVAGYAAAVAHRGIRHIRIPTTVLAQNDSGVGVKNGVNYKGKKNFLGTFAPPAAVFNDDVFLTSLSDRDWRSGMAEAVKVALIKDGAFFEWMEANADLLSARNKEAMNYLIHRCAALHIEHISSGDPFEMGSSRPLDFGHWSAHKLEQLTNFEVRHGEAVALGIALDSVYSFLSGRLLQQDAERIIVLLQRLGFDTTHPLLVPRNESSPVLLGLQEFREHLGGKLTIMLLVAIGRGEEVHQLDTSILIQAGEWLQRNNTIPSLQ